MNTAVTAIAMVWYAQSESEKSQRGIFKDDRESVEKGASNNSEQ